MGENFGEPCKEKFGEQATVSAYGKYTFCASVNIGE